jgi:hypothetical protein
MTRFRYRVLRSEFDPRAVRHGGRNSSAWVEESEAPLKVEASEFTATASELEGLLRRHEVVKSDLVFSQGGWTTFADSVEFGDLCATLFDGREFWRRWRPLIVNLGTFVLILGALLAFILFSARR